MGPRRASAGGGVAIVVGDRVGLAEAGGCFVELVLDLPVETNPPALTGETTQVRAKTAAQIKPSRSGIFLESRTVVSPWFS